MHRVTSSIHSGARYIYSGRIRSLAESLGVNSHIVSSYRKILYLLSERAIKLELNNQEVVFLLDNFDDSPIFYREPIMPDLMQESKSDDAFLDIGANFGQYTCTFAAIHPESTVISIEPTPETAEKLLRNLRQNGLNADLYQVALSDYDGKVKLATHDSPGYNHLVSDSRPDSQNTIEVTVREGDSFLKENQITTPNIIKIDVEGEEYKVLKGLEETLSVKECRLLYCEVHQEVDDSEAGLDNIIELLKGFGFELEFLQSHNQSRDSEQEFIKAYK